MTANRNRKAAARQKAQDSGTSYITSRNADFRSDREQLNALIAMLRSDALRDRIQEDLDLGDDAGGVLSVIRDHAEEEHGIYIEPRYVSRFRSIADTGTHAQKRAIALQLVSDLKRIGNDGWQFVPTVAQSVDDPSLYLLGRFISVVRPILDHIEMQVDIGGKGILIQVVQSSSEEVTRALLDAIVMKARTWTVIVNPQPGMPIHLPGGEETAKMPLGENAQRFSYRRDPGTKELSVVDQARMPLPEDFQVQWDEDLSFDFFEDDNATGLWAFGTIDPEEFVRQVNHLDTLNGASGEGGYSVEDVQLRQAVIAPEPGSDGADWRIRIVTDADTVSGTVAFIRR